MSIAPTVLQLFGLPVADDIDGEPIAAAFTADFLAALPPRREIAPGASATPVTVPSSGQPEYSEADSAKVEERLRKLGYLD